MKVKMILTTIGGMFLGVGLYRVCVLVPYIISAREFLTSEGKASMDSILNTIIVQEVIPCIVVGLVLIAIGIYRKHNPNNGGQDKR